LGIYDKKIILLKTKQMVISNGIPAVPRNRKLSEFRFKPFHGRENNSEFCSVEQKSKKTIGIPERTLQQKINNLELCSRGTRIEANSWNSLPNPSAEEKTTRNSLPWSKNRSKFSEFLSEPFRGREND
jgi:hypothetical protein